MIALGIVFAVRGAGLHEACDHARIDDLDFADRMRLGKGFLGRLLVADRNVEQEIAGMVRPDLRRILPDGVDDAGDRRQRCPLHFDRFNGVARMIDCIGDDKGDGVADVPHLVLCQDRIGRTGERVDLEIEQARQIAEIANVGRGQHQRDAGQRAGRRGIDGEPGMRVRRAQHQRVHRRLRRDVVGIAALAADERVILLAKHALTDAEFYGSSHFVSVSRSNFCSYCSGLHGSANAH